MNNYFTKEEMNAALDFAYAMGLKRPESVKQAETNLDLDFAYAMGLKKDINETTKTKHGANNTFAVPRLRFI